MFKMWLTVDIEDDRHTNYRTAVSEESSIQASLESLLEIFESVKATGTLFVVGEIAWKYRSILREFVSRGYDIGCHSLSHRMVYEMRPVELREDTSIAKRLIEDTLGVCPKGYRAPSWSVREGMLWFYDILEEFGFEYSSSVFPMRNYLYGIDGAPVRPYLPGEGRSGRRIIELPAPIAVIGGMKIPYCGGFYFRALPFTLSCSLHRYFARKYGASMFYFHPSEIGGTRKAMPSGIAERMMHSMGVRRAKPKLMSLLNKAHFVSSGEYILLHQSTEVRM